ncbi:hypothetical protein A2U01_0083230, partial [Trifolium medium]|nr:hypothetical protein [Trifolium medium]
MPSALLKILSPTTIGCLVAPQDSPPPLQPPDWSSLYPPEE